MECLWEQVYQGEGNRSIPGWLQRPEVAGEGCGVAGDVDDLAWLNGGEALADFCTEASTRRVNYDEVWAPGWRRFEEAEGVHGYALGRYAFGRDAFVTGAVEIASEIGGGGG
jgi:hypothetical protein